MKRPLVVVIALLLLAGSSPAQGDKADLRVKVLYTSSHPARAQLRVELTTGSGTYVRQAFTDDSGNAEFHGVDPGNYRLRVVDPDVEETLTDTFTILRRERVSLQLLTVKLKAEAEGVQQQLEAREAIVSALELNVPGSAKKEFKKGAEAMASDQNERARKHFEKAIEIYPQYAMAFNHLGVVLMNLGQTDAGRAAFEQAVAINDRYPSALVNLSKLRFRDGKIVESEALLQKALSSDPANVEALALLCNAELYSGKLEEAIGHAKRAHALPHQQFAAVHYVLARALEKANRSDEALAEYSLFLQEAPTSAGAASVRAAIARLKAMSSVQR